MSADWHLEFHPECECESHDWNLTYNLGAMLAAAGWPTRDKREGWDPASFSTGDRPAADWDVLKGAKAGELAPMVAAVVTNLEDDPDTFKKFNPDNGWGDYDGCLKVMRSFLAACQAHPDVPVGAWL